MNRFLLKILIRARKIISPINFWILFNTKYKGVKIPDKWHEAKKLHIIEFSHLINSYPYKPDTQLAKGFFMENSIQFPNFFFVKLESDRDCDDYHKLWHWYFEYNKHLGKFYTIYLADKTGHHMTGVLLNKSGKYQPIDYQYRDIEYSTLDKAVRHIADMYDYKDYIYEVYRVSK